MHSNKTPAESTTPVQLSSKWEKTYRQHSTTHATNTPKKPTTCTRDQVRCRKPCTTSSIYKAMVQKRRNKRDLKHRTLGKLATFHPAFPYSHSGQRRTRVPDPPYNLSSIIQTHHHSPYTSPNQRNVHCPARSIKNIV